MSGGDAFGNPNYLRMAVTLGADRGVAKPLSAGELVSILSTLTPPAPGLSTQAAVA